MLLLTISMLAFGSIGIFRRLIPLSSALIAFYRGLIGSIFLLAVMLLRKKTSGKAAKGKSLVLLMIIGCMIGINWLMLFESYNFTSVSVATLCYYMQPTFFILLSCLFLRERLTIKKLICLVLSLAGMFLISGIADVGVPEREELTGILLGLGAAALYALIVLLNKKICDIDPFLKTFIQLVFASAIMVPYLMVTKGFGANDYSRRSILLLLLVGIFHTGLCYTMYFGSMEKIRPQTIALFSYIDPVTALILSAVILHEKLTLLSIIGAVLILGAAVWGEVGDSIKGKAASSET